MVYPDKPTRPERATSGLAYALDGPCLSLAQDAGHGKTNNNSHSPQKLTADFQPYDHIEIGNQSLRGGVSPAIRILLDQHDDIILAYLRFAPSLHQNSHSFPDHGSLSSHQVCAVWTLKDCSDLEIRGRLEEARKLCETIRYYFDVQVLTPTSK